MYVCVCVCVQCQPWLASQTVDLRVKDTFTFKALFCLSAVPFLAFSLHFLSFFFLHSLSSLLFIIFFPNLSFLLLPASLLSSWASVSLTLCVVG